MSPVLGAPPSATRLTVYLDGAEAIVVGPPAVIAPRAWVLGVVAVQATVGDRGPVAALRAHVTGGAAPTVIPLGERAVVHVGLGEHDPPRGSDAYRYIFPATARLALHLDGVLVDESRAATPPGGSGPAPRAFSHVFCRWLRDGGVEAGVDLTDFLSLPLGAKFERRLVRTVAAPAVATLVWERGAV